MSETVEITPEIELVIRHIVEEEKFSAASIYAKFHKGQNFISSLALELERLGIIGPANGIHPRELTVKTYDEIIAVIERSNKG